MIRSVRSNPFMPGSDAVPEVWAGRALELADFRDVVTVRRTAGVYERGRLVVGEPGIGKSVLLGRLAADATDAGHWVLPGVRLAAGDDPVARLLHVARLELEARSTAAGVESAVRGLLDRVLEVTVPVLGSGVKLARGADPSPVHVLLTEVMGALARLASDDAPGRLVLVRLDEVQHLAGRQLSQVLTALGDVLNAEAVVRDPAGGAHRDKLPVAIYLSGLPDFYARAAAAGATFARRFKPLELGPLEEADLELALRPFTTAGWPILGESGPERVRMQPEGARALIDASHGSPFLFQLVGEAAWNAGPGELITAAEARAGIAAARRETVAHFRLRLQGLTDLQQAFLRAAAQLDDHERTAGAVASLMGSTSATLASTARQLDERHRLIRREAGVVRFRSPGLVEHLREDGA